MTPLLGRYQYYVRMVPSKPDDASIAQVLSKQKNRVLEAQMWRKYHLEHEHLKARPWFEARRKQSNRPEPYEGMKADRILTYVAWTCGQISFIHCLLAKPGTQGYAHTTSVQFPLPSLSKKIFCSFFSRSKTLTWRANYTLGS